MKRTIVLFCILLFAMNSQTLAQKKSEKEYIEIEKIITQGRIIHKERESILDEEVADSSLNLNTSDARIWKLEYLYLLIDYKDKLYSCYGSQRGFPMFINRSDWECYHVFEKPRKKK